MSKKGKSIELARLLHGQILNKTLPPGSQLDSISSLAKRYHTTVATVSKAFDLLEQQGLIDRHAGKGCYVKEKAICSFALVFDSGSDREGEFNYKPVFLKIFHRLCLERGYQYEVFNNIDSAKNGIELKRKIDHGTFDVILVASRYFAENHEKYLANSMAIVIGLYSYKWINCTISISTVNVVYEGGKELIKAGCERIALLNDKRNPEEWSNSPNEFIYNSYREMLRQNGILFDPNLVKNCTLDPKAGYDAAMELLKENHEAGLGIICGDALITLGVLQAVLQAGRKLNEEIYIVSHVNPECPLAKFPLPVIAYEAPVAEQTEMIFELARRRLSNNENIMGHHIIHLGKVN